MLKFQPELGSSERDGAHFAFDAGSLQTLQLGGIILIVHSPLVAFILENVSKSLMV